MARRIGDTVIERFMLSEYFMYVWILDVSFGCYSRTLFLQQCLVVPLCHLLSMSSLFLDLYGQMNIIVLVNKDVRYR